MKKRAPSSAKGRSSSGRDYLEIRLPRLSSKGLGFNGFFVLALIILVATVGVLGYKVYNLERTVKEQILPNQPQAVPTEDLSPKKVSVDDDPVLGEKNAKVTLIDFSDYECPFCKKYFDETYSQIKKEYVDKGLVKIVFRDLPLSFHANAHKEAQAAECAREQDGDEAYFKYHDEIFKRTTSGGTGIALNQLSAIANDLGLDGAKLQSCIDSEKYKAEVDKDLADAATVGATGTPTFFIGKSTNDGVILGTKLVGAQPFDEFKKLIEQELKK